MHSGQEVGGLAGSQLFLVEALLAGALLVGALLVGALLVGALLAGALLGHGGALWPRQHRPAGRSQALVVGAPLVGHGGALWPRQHRPAGRSQALVVGAPLVGHGGASWTTHSPSQITPQHRSGPQMECRKLLVYDDCYAFYEI